MMRQLLVTLILILAAKANAQSQIDSSVFIGNLHEPLPSCDKAWRLVDFPPGINYRFLRAEAAPSRIRGGIIHSNAYVNEIEIFFLDGSNQILKSDRGYIQQKAISSIMLYGSAGCDLKNPGSEDGQVKFFGTTDSSPIPSRAQ